MINNEAQIWKDRYYALKRWVENNIPPEVKEENKPQDDIITEYSDYWESREK